MKPLRALAKILTLSCEEATQLASESLDRNLTTAEATAAGVHNVVCPGCRRFKKQILFLRAAIRRLDDAAAGGPSLPLEAREKIGDALRDP